MKVLNITAEQTLAIRHTVLWPDEPIALCQVSGDNDALHYGIEIDNQLVCVASLYIDTQHNSVRLRKFATLPTFQNQGLGSQLLQAMLNDCREQGLSSFWCDARESAIGFYQRFGLAVEGERFYKKNVPYFKMVIDHLTTD